MDLSADEAKVIDTVAEERGIEAYKSVGKKESKPAETAKAEAKTETKK
ncbi:hypothetical protein G6024_14730 [Dietzia maris]|nr:hypothetical protein [Dietzia maris]